MLEISSKEDMVHPSLCLTEVTVVGTLSGGFCLLPSAAPLVTAPEARSNSRLENSGSLNRGFVWVGETGFVTIVRRPATSKGFSNLSSAPEDLNLLSSKAINEDQSMTTGICP